jgi:hypothetical protein
VTVADDRDVLLGQIKSGRWLGPVAVALVLDVHRNTVQNMMNDGRLKWRPHGGGIVREVDPQSVLRHMELTGGIRCVDNVPADEGDRR